MLRTMSCKTDIFGKQNNTLPTIVNKLLGCLCQHTYVSSVDYIHIITIAKPSSTDDE